MSVAPSRAQINIPLAGPLLASDTAAQDRIILYDVSNSGRRELTFGDGLHRVWDFSPDGCRLLLTLNDGSEFTTLYSAKIDGSDHKELVTYPALPSENWGVWYPEWSPDGTRITFTLITDDLQSGKREYYIAWVNADGGEPQLYSSSGDEHDAVWSPDGRWLAYMAYERRVPGVDINSTAVPTPEGQTSDPSTLLREADLWIVSYDGATKYRLTNFPTGSARAPRWSPDGELVGFIYSPSPSNDQVWMISSQPNAIPTQLSYEWNLSLDLTWFPDGTAMMGALRDFQGIGENRLWRIPLIGNADTDATPYLSDPVLTYTDYPRFSADARWLAFRSSYGLALLDTINQAWTLLDENALGNTPPVWSPSGFTGEQNCS
jgi:Tol biopolymer transport system component